MFRTIRRVLAVTAIAALVPAAAQAQAASCFFNVAAASAGSCNIAASAAVTVPKLGRLSVADSSIAFTQPDWDAFLQNPAATTTVTNVQIDIRSNATYNLTMTPGSWSSAWAVGDVSYKIGGSVCTDATGATTLATGSNSLITSGGATNGNTQQLCLALTYPGDLSNAKLAPGSYTLPITLTLAAP